MFPDKVTVATEMDEKKLIVTASELSAAAAPVGAEPEIVAVNVSWSAVVETLVSVYEYVATPVAEETVPALRVLRPELVNVTACPPMTLPNWSYVNTDISFVPPIRDEIVPPSRSESEISTRLTTGAW
jgi:hypothetical protein